MGSKSSSSKSSATTSNQIGAEDGGTAIGDLRLDNVAFDNSQTFDENAARVLESISSDSLDTVRESLNTIENTSQSSLNAIGESISFGRAALDTVLETVQNSTKQAEATIQSLSLTRQLQDTGTTSEAINYTPIVLGGIALLVVGYALTRGK